MSTTQQDTPALRLPSCPGPVRATRTAAAGLRVHLDDGPEDLTFLEAEQLLARLTSALFLARTVGDRIAEQLLAELRGHSEPTDTGEDLERDADAAPAFDLPSFGPLATSWTPRTGFRYSSAPDRLDLDDSGARLVQDALEHLLRELRAARRTAGDDLEGGAWR